MDPILQQMINQQNNKLSRSARKRQNRRIKNSLRSDLSVNRPIQAPVAKARVRRSARPNFVGLNGSGDIMITHREYITDLSGSVSFTANSFSINPGLPGVFPWLNNIAQRYESYLFKKLRFCFETESATSATGSVLLAIDYDASDAAPGSKTQVMAYRNSVRSPPWSDSCMESLPEDLHKRNSYYVRNGSLSSNIDVKLYDVGNFFACTQGQAGTTTVGELYVEYQIILMTPQMGEAGAGEVVSGNFAGTANSAPFTTKAGGIPATVVSSGTTTSVNTFTFSQPWQGIVTLSLVGTGITGVAATGTAASVEFAEVINAASTADVVFYSVVADIGSTFILTIGNSTISSALAVFAQFDV